jgi:hypothetical protein
MQKAKNLQTRSKHELTLIEPDAVMRWNFK